MLRSQAAVLCEGTEGNQPMQTLETANRNWLAEAKLRSDLSRDVAALAARIGADCTRGDKDISELWRLIRMARELGA